MKKNKEEKEEECGGSGEKAVGRNVKIWMEKGRVEKRRGGRDSCIEEGACTCIRR